MTLRGDDPSVQNLPTWALVAILYQVNITCGTTLWLVRLARQNSHEELK